MYHHPSDNDGYQYIELYNRGTSTIALGGWSFTSGITYTFAQGVTMPPGAYLVVANDPTLLAATYKNLILGANLVGPWTGSLGHHREHIRLSFPLPQTDPKTGKITNYMVTEDEVTYYDGGQWPTWADGKGASLELRDPHSNNDTPAPGRPAMRAARPTGSSSPTPSTPPTAATRTMPSRSSTSCSSMKARCSSTTWSWSSAARIA